MTSEDTQHPMQVVPVQSKDEGGPLLLILMAEKVPPCLYTKIAFNRKCDEKSYELYI